MSFINEGSPAVPAVISHKAQAQAAISLPTQHVISNKRSVVCHFEPHALRREISIPPSYKKQEQKRFLACARNDRGLERTKKDCYTRQ